MTAQLLPPLVVPDNACRCGAAGAFLVTTYALGAPHARATLCDPCAEHLRGTLALLDDVQPSIYSADFKAVEGA